MCQVAFQKVKAILTHCPILAASNFAKTFKLAVDASDIGAGAVILQEDDKSIAHLLCWHISVFLEIFPRN